jgi:hypothetical protein
MRLFSRQCDFEFRAMIATRDGNLTVVPSMIIRLRAKPNPVPFDFEVMKGSNILLILLDSIPGPVSATERTTACGPEVQY